MAYRLTLTKEEQKAFDWVGNRYATGEAIADLLRDCPIVGKDGSLQVEYEWASEELIFHVPEHIAWEIRELRNAEDGLWPSFADSLVSKMEQFINQIV